MKKQILLATMLLVAFTMNAQVGVGTENPRTSLHIAGKNENAAGTIPGNLATGDGVIVSRVSTDLSSNTVSTGCFASREGALVYSNNAAGPGFYYCDGTDWVAVGGGSTASTTTRVVAAGSTLLDTDINGFIIVSGGSGAFNLDNITSEVDGTKVTFVNYNSFTGFSVGASNLSPGSQTATATPNKHLEYIYDAETNLWYSIGD